jgi:flagella basal body P-ring formation protein FlgA
MMFPAPFALAACLTLPVNAARVTAADLSPGFPGLESIPPETILSFAPAPGLERVFRIPELRAIAAQFHLARAPEEEICVARSMGPLPPAALLAAMQRQMPEAKITILEFSGQAAPQGEIVFRRNGLRSNSAAGAIWFGAVRYSPGHEFTIWARVTLTVPVARVVAKHDLAAGQRIEPEDVGVQIREEFPSTIAVLATATDIAGKSARASIAAGSPIRLAMLEDSKDVRPGDIVEVEVLDGGAHLKFEGRAEAAGCVGDVIAVRNPASGKRFVAKVQAKGRVFVGGSSIKENP